MCQSFVNIFCMFSVCVKSEFVISVPFICMSNDCMVYIIFICASFVSAIFLCASSVNAIFMNQIVSHICIPICSISLCVISVCVLYMRVISIHVLFVYVKSICVICMCHIYVCVISVCVILVKAISMYVMYVCVMYQIYFVRCVKEYIPTGCWLMYHVRLAGGIVASELQLMFIFSPTEYLIIIRRTGEGKNNKTQISPTFSTQNFGSI